jgi:hypothetical protein
VIFTVTADGGDVAKDRMAGVQPPGTTLRLEGVVLIAPLLLRVTLKSTVLKRIMGMGTNSLVWVPCRVYPGALGRLVTLT